MASSSVQDVRWSDLAVKNSISSHAATANQGVGGGEELLAALGNVGALLKSGEDEVKFQAVREATQRMLEARYQLDIHHAALVDLQRKYQATGATTNFNALLSESAAQLETEHPYESAADPLLLRFDEDAGIVADYEDEQIDDDIAIAGESTHQLGRNATCPITMRALLDIEDPVEDSKNFVYEKHAILEMLGRSASIKCPVAGTNHMLSKSDLRPARAVINAKKRGVNAANKNKNGGGGKKDMVLELD